MPLSDSLPSMKQMIYAKCVEYIDVIGALDVSLRRRRTCALILFSIDQIRQINIHCFQFFQVLLGTLNQVRRVESSSA